VYEVLQHRITEGGIGEEQPLVIASLVREFGISQTPVREALARLHAEGLATFTDNVGYRVAPRPTSADYHNWMRARLVIEVGAMQSVSEVDQEAIARLSAINQQIESADFGKQFEGVRRFSDLNREFHRELIALRRNPFLRRAYDQIWLGAQFSRVHYERGVLDQEAIAREHGQILRALQKNDLDLARSRLASHIVKSLKRDASR
jgi:DNA-binding GntR family transcriptional regulator